MYLQLDLEESPIVFNQRFKGTHDRMKYAAEKDEKTLKVHFCFCSACNFCKKYFSKKCTFSCFYEECNYLSLSLVLRRSFLACLSNFLNIWDSSCPAAAALGSVLLPSCEWKLILVVFNAIWFKSWHEAVLTFRLFKSASWKKSSHAEKNRCLFDNVCLK